MPPVPMMLAFTVVKPVVVEAVVDRAAAAIPLVLVTDQKLHVCKIYLWTWD